MAELGEGWRVTEPQDPTAPSPRTVLVLKIIVVGLAVLIVAGLAAVVWRIMHLASARPAATAAATAPASASAALAERARLALPDGAEIGAVALDGDRLAVHYRSSAGNGIAIMDLVSGREIARVMLGGVPAAR